MLYIRVHNKLNEHIDTTQILIVYIIAVMLLLQIGIMCIIFLCKLVNCFHQQTYLHPLMVMWQWFHWMKQARSESLGADQHWDLVKRSLVTMCSTGEGYLLLTPPAQCLALVQPHTPSPTSLWVQCMKWELHQNALLDWVDTVVGVVNKLWHITVSYGCECTANMHLRLRTIYTMCLVQSSCDTE